MSIGIEVGIAWPGVTAKTGDIVVIEDWVSGEDHRCEVGLVEWRLTWEGRGGVGGRRFGSVAEVH